jgi:gliding motility-associated-like protein
MKKLFYIFCFLFPLFGYTQQVVELCDDGQTTFTYSSPQRLSGVNVWTLNPGTGSSDVFVNEFRYTWTEIGEYKLRLIFITNTGCYDSTFYTIKVIPCTQTFMWFPNAFTPTGDARNETWSPKGINYTDLQYSIYNRWGELVFNSNSEDKPWDGTLNNKPCQTDVYIFVCFWKGIDKRNYKKYGHISLIR